MTNENLLSEISNLRGQLVESNQAVVELREDLAVKTTRVADLQSERELLTRDIVQVNDSLSNANIRISELEAKCELFENWSKEAPEAKWCECKRLFNSTLASKLSEWNEIAELKDENEQLRKSVRIHQDNYLLCQKNVRLLSFLRILTDPLACQGT